MTRAPAPAVELVCEAARLVIACRAGRSCPTHTALARTLGVGVPTLRIALARLHGAGALKIEQLTTPGGTRTRMRALLPDYRWSGWTSWSALVPYGATTQALMRLNRGGVSGMVSTGAENSLS